MGTDIVVGIDGSANSHEALLWALDEAEVRDVRVRAVLTWSFMGEGESVLGMGTTEADAKAALDESLRSQVPDRMDRIDQVTVNDLAVPGLLAEAATGALLVVGSRGRGAIKGMLLGSTSRKVIEKSPVPVVVVPHHT
jgi:nucleotide-binding universal stress UspA family protein